MRYFLLLLLFGCGSDSSSPNVTIPENITCPTKTGTNLVEETEKEKCPIEQAKEGLGKSEQPVVETKKEETVSAIPTASTTTATVSTTASTTTATAAVVATTAATTPAACGAISSGSSASRTRYQASSVSYGQTCSSETQTALCTNGTLADYSGTYLADSCSVEAAAACGAISHGASQSRTRYQNASVAYGASCVSETQSAICNNGTFGAYSGTYANSSCSAAAPANCGATLHGQTASRTKYQASSVAFGQTCSSQTQTGTCNNGTLNYSGSYTYDSCVIDDPAACGATANGAYASRTRYQASSVAYGSTCSSEAQQALCTNGTLSAYSGSYAFDSCSVTAPAACGATAHGGTTTRTKYQASSVAYGSTCSSETQSATCNNGSFGSYSGTYTFDSCSVDSPANCGAVNHGNSISRTRYQYLTLAYKDTPPYANCSNSSEVQTSTCNNGTMSAYSGTYTYSDCAVRSGGPYGHNCDIKNLNSIKTNGTKVIIGVNGIGKTLYYGTVFDCDLFGNYYDGYGEAFAVANDSRVYGGQNFSGLSRIGTAADYILPSLVAGWNTKAETLKDLYVNPTNSSQLWAATANGIFYSADTGATFTQKTTEPARSIFKSVSSALLVNTESNGLIIYRQTDYTVYRSFTTGSGLPSDTVNSSWCNSLCWSVTGKMAVGTPSGLALSTNGGTNWTTKTTANGLPSNNILFVHVPNADGQTIYLGTPVGLAISTDGGANWTTRYTGSDSNINGIITYGSDIWMTSSSWGLWKLQ